MQINNWFKTTNFKLFGKTIFTKEEICNDFTQEKDSYNIIISEDYCNTEFKINKKKDS